LPTLLRRHARWLEGRSAAFATLGARARRPRAYSPEDDFALGNPDSAPSAATMAVLSRVAIGDAAARRRANYSFLLGELGHLVPTPFALLAEGASPHAFPIETPERQALLDALDARGIRAFSFWTHRHPLLPADGFPATARWRERLAVLPVHQELRRQDLRRIAVAVREAQGDGGGPARPEAISSYTRS
jgi:hypothetical protein